VTRGYTTIIAPIVKGQVQELKRHLRNHVEPCFDALTGSVRCKALFRFDQIPNLHFCSLVVLDGDSAFDPYLVFEATFDGPRDDFLCELTSVALEGIDSIYEFCQGYPESGLAVPELIKEYLANCDVGAHAFYSGTPGRSVAQVQGESRLRDEIVTYLSGLRSANTLPPTLAGLQQQLRNELIRRRSENRWAEQPIKVPWEVVWGRAVIKSAALATMCGLGGLVLVSLGQGPFVVFNLVECLSGYLGARAGSIRSDVAGNFIQYLAGFLVATFWMLWVPLRIGELSIRSSIKDPSNESFALFLLLHIAVLLRYALLVSLVAFAVLALFDQAVNPAKSGIDTPPHLLVSLMLLTSTGLIWLVLQHWSTSLQLTVDFRELTQVEDVALRRECSTSLLLDVVQFARVAALSVPILMLAWHIPSGGAAWFASALSAVVIVLLILVVYLSIGLMTAYAVGTALLLVVRGRERAERKRLAAATALTQRLPNNSDDGREAGGINTCQNHLASLTYVKPGLMRRWLLRLTLLASAFLTRFWFNRGTLAEIPTILAARWVMIDGGRRLLFLSNYCGALGSYLGEFTDMGAKSVNAVWTNTFVKMEGRQYAFPETDFYIWKGAHADRAFRAYVRQSQVETIVWYSAYPNLSVENINTNSNVRRSLFKQLPTCELDTLFQSL
jgi:hypothetical protein